MTAAWGEGHAQILRLISGPGHCVCRWSFNSTQLSFPSRYQRPFEFSNGCGQYTTYNAIFTDCAPDGRLSFQTCMGRTESAILGGTLQKFWKLKETHTYTFTVSKTHMRACVRAFMPKAYILILAVSRFSSPDCLNKTVVAVVIIKHICRYRDGNLMGSILKRKL